MSWPRPGPGRPPAQKEFAAWKGFLHRKEWLRVRVLEDKIRNDTRVRSELALKALQQELSIIRNRAVKRANRP